MSDIEQGINKLWPNLKSETVNQHCLLSMDMVLKKKVRRKVKFKKKLKLWRLRESEVKEEFA